MDVAPIRGASENDDSRSTRTGKYPLRTISQTEPEQNRTTSDAIAEAVDHPPDGNALAENDTAFGMASHVTDATSDASESRAVASLLMARWGGLSESVRDAIRALLNAGNP